MAVGNSPGVFVGVTLPKDDEQQKKSFDSEENKERYEKLLNKPESTKREEFRYGLIEKKIAVPIVKNVTIASTSEAIDKYYNDDLSIMVSLPNNEFLVIKLDVNYATPKMQKENENLKNEILKYKQLAERSTSNLEKIKILFDEITAQNIELRVKAEVLDKLEPYLKTIFESVTISPKKKRSRKKTEINKV